MKKFLTIVLGLALTLGTLSGCDTSGGKETGTPATTSPEKTESAEPTEKASEGTGEAVDGWAPIGTADAPIPVKVVVKDVMPDEEDVIAMIAVVEEKMAAHGQYIKLEFAEPPAGSYGSAMPLAVRGGEVDADVIYFQGGDQPISQEELILDLSDYIKNSTHVKNIMEPASVARMENYPFILWLAPARVAVPVMRKDFAEQLDSYDELVKDPTVDNYFNMFKEMKEKGLVEYAITADGSTARWDSIFNQAFGVTSTIIEEDGTYVFSKATSAEKDKLEFYAKLYAEGLIDPDYLTNSWDVAEQKFYESKVGMYIGNTGATTKIYNDKMVSANGDGAELVVLPPAKGVAQGYAAVDITKEPRGLAINADSQNPDAAWAFLEFMASPEGRIIDKLGIEGVHHEITDGKITFTDKFPNWWSRIWETTYNFDPETPLAESIYPKAAEDSLEMANEYYVEDVNILMPEELIPINDGLNSIYLEYSTDIITGNKEISAFDEFITEWNKAGADQFTPYFDEALR